MVSKLFQASSGAALLALGLFMSAPVAATELQGDAVFSALKEGGYVVYLRHAGSDKSQTDADPINVADCATQRNLSDDGRTQAASIGEAMKKLGIAVDGVLTSPYCRARDTATLAFGSADDSQALYYSLGLSKADAEKAAADLKSLLSTAPAAGKNRVLVGHTSNIKEVAGVWPKTEGAAFVIKPMGDGKFEVIGGFSADELLSAGS